MSIKIEKIMYPQTCQSIVLTLLGNLCESRRSTIHYFCKNLSMSKKEKEIAMF